MLLPRWDCRGGVSVIKWWSPVHCLPFTWTIPAKIQSHSSEWNKISASCRDVDEETVVHTMEYNATFKKNKYRDFDHPDITSRDDMLTGHGAEGSNQCTVPGKTMLINACQISPQKFRSLPWLVWLSGLSASLRTERLLVRFPVRAHAWLAVGSLW
ncbi:hypothetical protein HJG60_010012 [Phyllostomus discolor]|uniref:Uncharacterized protein n=1 Tax=Phyllostomus discolor TaxID=89673 RepID=A0A834EFZ6_9CHIR|nr:hypothetical protein HJG60_010012 [Phyllostomus discolor]